jgi:hypothetical protein
VPVIVPNNSSVQLFILTLIFVVWLVSQLSFCFWRFRILNQFDTFSSVLHVLCLNCFSSLQYAGQNSGMDSSQAETMSWTLIVLFCVLCLAFICGAGFKVYKHITNGKRIGVFLSHHKGSAGIYCRQLKMMCSAISRKHTFLDVDELQNLDNLNFMVRTDTSNVVLVLTEEALTRLWVSLEVTVAYLNEVPIIVGKATKNAELPTASFIEQLPDMFSEKDWLVLHNNGVSLENVQAAYRHIAALKLHDLRMDSPFDDLWANLKGMLSKEAVDFPLSETKSAPDPDLNLYLCYDTANPGQICVARVLQMSLQQGSWTVNVGVASGNVPAQAVAVVLLSSELYKNPECLAQITSFAMQQIEVVTVLGGGETFSKPDESIIAEMRRGQGLSVSDWDLIARLCPEIYDHDEVADALANMYKILAWRFSPEETDVIIKAEFKRLNDRMLAVAAKKRSGQKAQVQQPGASKLLLSSKGSDEWPEPPVTSDLTAPPDEAFMRQVTLEAGEQLMTASY